MTRLLGLLRVALFAIIGVSAVMTGATSGTGMEVWLGVLVLAVVLESMVTEYRDRERRRRDEVAETLRYLAAVEQAGESPVPVDDREDEAVAQEDPAR